MSDRASLYRRLNGLNGRCADACVRFLQDVPEMRFRTDEAIRYELAPWINGRLQDLRLEVSQIPVPAIPAGHEDLEHLRGHAAHRRVAQRTHAVGRLRGHGVRVRAKWEASVRETHGPLLGEREPLVARERVYAELNANFPANRVQIAGSWVPIGKALADVRKRLEEIEDALEIGEPPNEVRKEIDKIEKQADREERKASRLAAYLPHAIARDSALGQRKQPEALIAAGERLEEWLRTLWQ